MESLKQLIKRDILRLKREIALYNNEDAIWLVNANITNSAGNLCLHLIGNLNAYLGVGLAGTSYIRKRDLEFSLKGIPKAQLINSIDETILVVESALNKVTGEQANNDFPIVIWDKPTRMMYTLVQLSTHLNYHLGQINYHRRLLDKS